MIKRYLGQKESRGKRKFEVKLQFSIFCQKFTFSYFSWHLYFQSASCLNIWLFFTFCLFVCVSKKMCVFVVTLWVCPPPLCKYVCPFVGLHCDCVPPLVCVCSFGYIVGVSPPIWLKIMRMHIGRAGNCCGT